MRRCITLLVMLFLVASAEESTVGRFEKVVNRMVKAINEGDYVRIGSDFDRTMEDFFPLEKRKPFFENLSAQYGKIIRLDKPRLVQPSQAIFVANCEHGKLDITVWLDENNNIIGLLFLPHKPTIPAPEKHETELFLACCLGGVTLRNSTNIMTRPIRGLHLTFLALTKRATLARARPK